MTHTASTPGAAMGSAASSAATPAASSSAGPTSASASAPASQGGRSHGVVVPAVDAEAVAVDHARLLTGFFNITQKVAPTAQKCTWQLGTAIGLSPENRAAVAWIIADAAMKRRSGRSKVHATWRAAALGGTKLTDNDHQLVSSFVDSVFGLPPDGKSEEHLVGHVAEWMWFLTTSETVDPTRTAVLLEAPKFNVTEPGADGFIVFHQTATDDHHFRLWELKKHTGAGSVTSTVSTAYRQLETKAMRYLAQQVSTHSLIEGPVGELCSMLGELWLECHESAGAGVGVTSATTTPPTACFTTMGQRFPGFDKPGQLEGLLLAVEDLLELAKEVRGYLWTVL